MITKINLCVLGCPLPPYIKEQGEGAGRPSLARQGSPTPTGVGFPPPNPSPTRFPEGEREGEGSRPLLLVLLGLGKGGEARGLPGQPFPPFPLRPMRPIMSPGGSGNPPGTPVNSCFRSEPFRSPNIGFQYINLYVSTIPRLLVMSVITSGTPNSFGTSKYTNS